MVSNVKIAGIYPFFSLFLLLHVVAKSMNSENDKKPDIDLLIPLAEQWIQEQRRDRKWRIFFRFLFYSLFILGFLVFFSAGKDQDELMEWRGASGRNSEHVALIRLDGIISDQNIISVKHITESLRAAFESPKAQAIIIEVNSPGGSPVQSFILNDEINRLQSLYPDKPVFSVVTDVCASGAYLVAVAADSIFANPSSIVGSIGVVISQFGFVELMKTYGIQRRVITAGVRKNMLDPFLPEKEKDVQHLHAMLDAIHQKFIDRVLRDRKGKLDADNQDIFSGLVWTGSEAVGLGLIDGFGDADQVAREHMKIDNVVEYRPERRLLEDFIERFTLSITEKFARLIQGIPIQ